MTDTDRLLREEDAAWHELVNVLEGMTEPQLETPGLTADGWSAKDAMFHLGAWLAECARQLERMRAGTFVERVDTVSDIDRTNRAWFEVSRTLDLRTAKIEMISSRTIARTVFGRLDEVTPAAWEWFEESGPIHYREHVTDLRAWAGHLAAR